MQSTYNIDQIQIKYNTNIGYKNSVHKTIAFISED